MTGLLPGISVAQMRDVDRLMIEEYGIALLQMMENAGRSLAELARLRLADNAEDRHVVVLVGLGNNGGGGLVAARHLANAGASVTVALTGDPPLPGDVPEHQRRVLERMGMAGSDHATSPAALPDLLSSAALVVDALLGYSGRGAPREPIARFILAANAAAAPRLALDLPSGLDGDTGLPATPCLRADATLTLAWPKVGLLATTALPIAGELFLTAIGIPPPIYRAVGVELGSLFSQGPIVRVHPVAGGWEAGAALRRLT
jgi:NAD(P)H-hydrate epimerase